MTTTRNTIRLAAAIVLSLCLAAVPSAAWASIGYIATGSNSVDGKLYTVDTDTAQTQEVGDLLVGADPIGITGLAFHPVTGVLYGVTTNASAHQHRRTLVTIDPATAAATLIGSYSVSGSAIGDITFVGGTLYGQKGGDSTPGSTEDRLYTLNLATGAATLVGPIGSNPDTDLGGFGLAADAAGTMYASLYGNLANDSPTLDTYNAATGERTDGVSLSGDLGSNDFDVFAALAFDAEGDLYGTRSDRAGIASVALTSIDPATGVVTEIGALPDNTDAIAFAPIPEPASAALLALGGLTLFRRGRKHERQS